MRQEAIEKLNTQGKDIATLRGILNLLNISRLEALAALSSEPEDDWIPVSERLPKRCQPYTVSQDTLLVCAGRVYKGTYDVEKGWLIYASYNRQEEYQDKVTHWKPIILPSNQKSEPIRDSDREYTEFKKAEAADMKSEPECDVCGDWGFLFFFDRHYSAEDVCQQGTPKVRKIPCLFCQKSEPCKTCGGSRYVKCKCCNAWVCRMDNKRNRCPDCPAEPEEPQEPNCCVACDGYEAGDCTPCPKYHIRKKAMMKPAEQNKCVDGHNVAGWKPIEPRGADIELLRLGYTHRGMCLDCEEWQLKPAEPSEFTGKTLKEIATKLCEACPVRKEDEVHKAKACFDKNYPNNQNCRTLIELACVQQQIDTQQATINKKDGIILSQRRRIKMQSAEIKELKGRDTEK